MLRLRDDISYALRLLARQPAFACTAILLLALGIGVNSAIFSIVDSVLLRPLPYKDSHRLYTIWTRNLTRGIPQASFSAPDFADYSARLQSFASISAMQIYSATMTGKGQPARVMTMFVSPSYFEMLSLSPMLGRAFAAEEGVHGKNSVALLNEGFWRQRFGGDPSVIGKTMVLDGEVHAIVGVLPRIAGEAESVDLFLPKAFSPLELSTRNARYLKVMARLKDGVSERQAEEELRALSAREAELHPDADANWEAFLIPAQVEAQRNARQPLMVLVAAVGIVLLITCSNLANLLLVRSGTRLREVAIRSAMGASQASVFAQMITESVTLAVIGGGAGLLVAWSMIRAVAKWGPASIPRLQAASINLPVLGFTFIVSVLAGILFGAAPAWRVLRLNLSDTLRDESRGSSGGVQRSLMRSLLVVAEVALSVILLVGAGLLLRTFHELSRINTGFRADHVLTLRTTLPGLKYPTEESRAGYVRRIVRQLESTPGVISAGVTTALPMMSVNWTAQFTVDGQTTASGQGDTATYNAITPRYLEAVGARLKRGRDFALTDEASSTPVILISEALERRYFKNGDALGRYIEYRVSSHEIHAQIVGVVGDMAHLRPEEPPRVAIYQPYSQIPWPFLAFAVRTAGEPASMASAVRNAFYAVDSELPVERVQPFTKLVDNVLAQQRLAMVLLMVFSLLAVLLALVGLYGVLAMAVAQRGREIGIRMAMGAGAGDILRLILSQGLGLTLAGLCAGLACAPLVGSMMNQLLYGVQPVDAPTFAGVSLLILAAAMAASLIPARRAARMDPQAALRAE